MARHLVPIETIVNDYMIEMEDNDYGATRNAAKVRNIALSGLKDLRSNGLKPIRAYVLELDENTMSITLPNDFIDYARIGIVNSAGQFITMAKNPSLGMAYQQPLLDNLGAKLLDSDGVELTALRQFGGTQNYPETRQDLLIYRDTLSDYRSGGQYGRTGGGSWAGEFRVDLENSRIYFSSSVSATEIVLEYIYDETMLSNPQISEFAEEALKNWIYWKLINNKSNVPPSEKVRARRLYSNARTVARDNLNAPKNKAEYIMQFWAANSQQAPRTGGAGMR